MKVKIVYLLTACKKLGPVQQTLNIIKHLDKNEFEPILVTLYEEPQDGTSQLKNFLPYVEHVRVPLDKLDIILGRTKQLENQLDVIKPDVVHTLGTFPSYAISRMKKYTQLITLRDYIYYDGVKKYGLIKGMICATLDRYSISHASKTITCSASLSKIYKEKLNLNFSYIQNGVDVGVYTRATEDKKKEMRKKLNIPVEAFVFVYSSQIIERKNHRFLLEAFSKSFSNADAYLLLLGEGNLLEELRDKFGAIANIDFRGNVTNVEEYLKASDAYISTSISEGLPNGVLEAMASGIPYVLSDIPQHQEIYEADSESGFLYKQNDIEDVLDKMKTLMQRDCVFMGQNAYRVAHECFSAKSNSEKYQSLYKSLLKEK